MKVSHSFSTSESNQDQKLRDQKQMKVMDQVHRKVAHRQVPTTNFKKERIPISWKG